MENEIPNMENEIPNLENEMLHMDYSAIFNGDIKEDIAGLAAEVKKLVSFQEDLRQKNLIFERLNLVDKRLAAYDEKLSAFEDAQAVLRSDMAKLYDLCSSNKTWMEQIRGLVDYLLRREKERSGEGSESELMSAGVGL